MKRKRSFFLVAALAGVFAFGFSACEKEGNGENWSYQVSKKVSEGTVTIEIRVDEKSGDVFLIDVMNRAKDQGELSFKTSGGMVISMEGYANDADYRPCWMLYTTDEALANAEWGTLTVDGQTLGSAILGAEKLPVSEGELYVWAYVSLDE